jgi:hypothetical protein
MSNEPIYVDASQRATLSYSGHSMECFTLQEARLAWDRLPNELKEIALIEAYGGQVYSADQIKRLHYGPKPEA